MFTPRLRVTELNTWGRLVKSWATHLDYISQGYPSQPPRRELVNTSWGNMQPAPATVTDRDADGHLKDWALPAMSMVSIPKGDNSVVVLPGAVALTIAEFKAKTDAAGVEISELPGQYKHVIVLQGSVDTMVIRLPPMDTLQSSEDDLINGKDYIVPDFYGAKIFTGAAVTQQPPVGRSAIMELHAYRIGEYTLNNCD